MKYTRASSETELAWSTFPELAPANEPSKQWWRSKKRHAPSERVASSIKVKAALKTATAPEATGTLKSTMLSFLNMSQHGDLLVSFLRARKRIFVDRLHWNLPETDGMEFDQYDTPKARWIVVHEFGEVLAGIRLTPTTAKCGIYTYMLKDAQQGLLDNIPSDVLFFDAPVDANIWEASRLFISDDVSAERRSKVQQALMEQMASCARELGARHVIGIVPSVWSRWLRRLELYAVPVGPKFSIDGTTTQAALFNVYQ